MPHARLVTALLLLPAAAAAQQVAPDTARIAPLVVTATRSALASERAPASVTVLTGTALREQGITSVAEALRQVPGLSLAQSGSYGAATSLFIRGGESKFTKVLIDGVPANEAGGAFDFSTLTTDNIDRVEIVRGPTSVLYGSDAMAGVVQIFTRRGVPGATGAIAVRGGGFGTVDADASVRGMRGRAEYSIGAAHHDTRGFLAFNSAHRLNVGSLLVGVGGERGDVRLSLRSSDGATEFPTDGSGLVVDSNAVRREGRVALGIDGGLRLTPAAELRLALASHAAHGITDNQPDSPGDSAGYYYTTADRSWRRSADLRLEVALPARARLSVGGTAEGQWQESGTTSNFGDTPAEPRTRRTAGAYAQLLLAPAAVHTVTIGARYEHNERFGDFVTWRAASSVALGAGTRVRGSVGTAFREPSFLENFGCCGFVVGNPDLSPEQSLGADLGIEQALGDRATVGATLFHNGFRNLIDYVAAAQPNYVNIAGTRSRGLELEGRVRLPLGLHADAAVTYLDARVTDAGASTAETALFREGARLLRRPMHTVDAGIGVRRSRAGLELRGLHVGSREDNYFAPDFTSRRLTLPAYMRLDLSGDVTLLAPPRAGSVVATLRVENLADARYTDVAGANFDFAQRDLSSTGFRGAPRRVLVGVRVGF